MAGAGGQQRDVFGTPPLLEEQLDLVVADVHRVVAGAGDELHGRPLAAEEAHRVVDERLERVGDLAGVAQVVVEDQRDQRHRRRAVAVEDALAFVGEHVDAAGLVVLERGEQRVPPGVGEVLGLVDDDRVEPVTRLELRCQVGHLERQVVLPELDGLVVADGFVGTFGCAPQLAEVVELADVGRLLTSRPVGGDALQVGGQAVGVADERDALALRGRVGGPAPWPGRSCRCPLPRGPRRG